VHGGRISVGRDAGAALSVRARPSYTPGSRREAVFGRSARAQEELEMRADERKAELEALEESIRRDRARRIELLREDRAPVADRELLGWEGPVRLSELFSPQGDLVLIHNMGARCAYCTLWADGFNGILQHLENRAGFVVSSPDPPEAQKAFAQGRGWRFRMIHDPDARLTRELGYVEDRSGKPSFLPGVSILRREAGSILRVAHDGFGPGDPYCGIWHLFALFEGGAGEWAPRFRYE
jgi:peroxiredoxin